MYLTGAIWRTIELVTSVAAVVMIVTLVRQADADAVSAGEALFVLGTALYYQ